MSKWKNLLNTRTKLGNKKSKKLKKRIKLKR